MAAVVTKWQRSKPSCTPRNRGKQPGKRQPAGPWWPLFQWEGARQARRAGGVTATGAAAAERRWPEPSYYPHVEGGPEQRKPAGSCTRTAPVRHLAAPATVEGHLALAAIAEGRAVLALLHAAVGADACRGAGGGFVLNLLLDGQLLGEANSTSWQYFRWMSSYFINPFPPRAL